MERVIEAIWDGEALRPTRPVDLERDQRYRLVIDEVPSEGEISTRPGMFDDIAALATPFGISDLAEQHDHYLYGTPKR
jgi:hypothetical protein